VKARAGLLERFQERVGGLRPEQFRARDPHDAPRTLVRPASSKCDRFADAVDPDLYALRFDRQKVGVETVEHAAARFAAALAVIPRAKKSRRE
jgi:hypothetical protein